MLANDWTSTVQHLPEVGPIWPGELGSKSTNLNQQVPEIDQRGLASEQQMPELYQSRRSNGPETTKLGPSASKFDRALPGINQHWLDVDQSACPKGKQHRQNLARI